VPRPLEVIIAEFDSLSRDDFVEGSPTARGWEKLDSICDELQKLNDPHRSIPPMFALLERLDGCDLGSPGSVVHTLEAWTGHYEPYLAHSVQRKPTGLTAWMVNRILNGHPKDSGQWLALLISVTQHPGASDLTKSEAYRFLRHQGVE
jgi:hypothetical protein